MIVNIPKVVRVIGGCHKHAIGQIGTVIRYDYTNSYVKPGFEETFWLEFKDIVFEGADPKTQHPNRAYFFGPEVEVVK